MDFDFENDEFESFLKQKADQYKMYPSERVWKGIAFVQHSRTRLITIGGSLLLITVFFIFGGRFLTESDPAHKHQPQGASTVITRFSDAKSSPQLSVSPENARRSVVVATDIAQKNQVIDGDSEDLQASRFNRKAADFLTGSPGVGVDQIKSRIAIELPTPETSTDVETDRTIVESKEIKSVNPALIPPSVIASKVNEEISLEETTAKKINHATTGELPPTIDHQEAIDKGVNWLQEIAAIKLTIPKKSPFNLQFYFSPMVSYRKLVDNNGMKVGMASNSTIQLGTVNRFVDHKPAVGVELGSNLLYTPIKNLTLKTGVQLNYSRYTIKAFKSYVEKAAIALSSTTQHSRDTMVSYTTVRNFNGYSPEILENQYLQVSIPVGAELKLFGNKNLQFSIAGTVQPTYLIFNDSYLLSTDYQHYTKEPSLIRKWNLHTSTEAFISYRSGSIRWQVGPQFRYQTMSSYSDKYPIREYLMEYGIKFGLSKTLK